MSDVKDIRGDKSRAQLRKFITDEVGRQVETMREEITATFVEDLKRLRENITQDIMEAIQEYLNQEIPRSRRSAENVGDVKREIINEVRGEMEKKMENLNNQIVLANNKQIAVTKQLTKELTSAITTTASKQVYTAVIAEINNKIVPKVNNMVEWVNYNMQDTGELVTDYRRAVEEQSRSSDLKMLASSKGEDKKSWAGGNVRMMWDDNDAVT